MDYEDNAQYYLIWAVLMKRAGGTVNDSLVRRAYAFIREHEQDGLYVPPPLPGSPNPKGWKTYHDVLLYDEGDSPASNQGFHCGALLAAKELGLEVTEQDIDAANYLLAGVHGLPADEVDRLLVERIGREIAQVPAFNESISTVDGHPHGHVLYSWNSGYWWLRKEIRRRLSLTGDDPVERAVDAQLGVVREDGVLRLQSEK